MVNFVLSVNPADNHKTMRRLIAWVVFFHVVPVVFLKNENLFNSRDLFMTFLPLFLALIF